MNGIIRSRDELFWVLYEECTRTGSKGKREMLVTGKPPMLPVREVGGEPRKKAIMEDREQYSGEAVAV